MPVQEEIVGFCSSLAILVHSKDQRSGKEIRELRLAHFSVKEYLTSNLVENGLRNYFKETIARASIANVCLAYLIHLDQKFLANEVRESFPFAQYCAQYWMTHAVAGEEDETLQELMRDFFLRRKWAYHNCYQLYDPDTPWRVGYNDNVVTNPLAELYYASLVGLHSAVQMLLDQGANVNVQSGKYGNALQAASSEGHEQIAKLLLKNGADVSVRGGYYGNALQAASSKGHEQIVKLLLDKGADVNIHVRNNALYAASSEGHEQIVKLLLNKGANAQGGLHSSPLQAALSKGHEQIVKLLLDKGADANSQGGEYGSALQEALYRGYEQMAKLLLDRGADVNAQ
ncbi:hypothetical protein GP486_006055, partial [Trichoglossum hirsutum]